MSCVYNYNITRMDSCAGLIISPKELLKFANQVDGEFSQRGSLPGCESLLLKTGIYTMVVFCNRRKSYLQEILPLMDIFELLVSQF